MSVRRTTFAAVLLALVATGLSVTPRAAASEATSSIRAEISWTAAERFGLDADGNGLIDLPNTPRYVSNAAACMDLCSEARFDVTLSASVIGVTIPAGAIGEYRWRIVGEGLPGPLLYSAAHPELLVSLPEGRYQASVSVAVHVGWATLRPEVTTEVAVDDLLVVAIGDSYASGEGNPEVARTQGTDARWADSGHPEASAGHAAAHRSTLAWPARVALALERSDPTTSVTFVSVAASGARIEDGLLGPQGDGTPSQLEQIQALVGERRIDLLLIQAGGNDIGFAHAIQSLVQADPLLDPICYDRLIENVFASVADGDWSRGVSLGYEPPASVVCRPATSNRGWAPLPGIAGLPGAFQRLAETLEGFDIGEVLLVGYPDPTGGADGTCREIVGDTAPPLGIHEIDRNEQALGVARILEPLNQALGDAAAEHGFRFVDGVAAAFAAGHGYCAPWPDYGGSGDPGGRARGRPSVDDTDRWFRNPGRDGGAMLVGGAEVSWYRTAAQSAALQGPGARYLTEGTLHPNEVGHQAIARIVLAALGD